MELLKLHWLGHPLIERKGRGVKLETRKAAALLAYLSLNPGDCPREVLATMFWQDGNQQKALANLRRTLSSLNSSLPGWIQANRETIALKINDKLWVDVNAFHQSLSQLKKHSHSDSETCDECLCVLHETGEFYRGDFLEGLNLSDSPIFDEWQFFQRDGLRREFAEVLQRLTAEHSKRAEWDHALLYARRWVAMDQLNELAWRGLMEIYARSGQRSVAVHQYEELKRLLKEQMGQEPEEETRRLFEQLRGRAEEKQVVELPEPLSYPLLKTKLYIPSAPVSRVERSDLIERLGKVEEKALTIISAPAGFGKTTLLAEWIAQTSLPVAWLSLDNGDNDPYRFLSYLISALESIQEGIGTQTRQIIHSVQSLSAHLILPSLINDLGRIAESIVLVLDDFQFITEPAVNEAMTYLLDHVPSNLHLIISTRADPPLHLGRLRAHGQLLELRTQDLRFTPEETAEFLNSVMRLGLSAAEIEILEGRTEGWVVGLKMAALSIQGREEASEFIRAFSGSHRYILDYLVDEVLKRQPAHIQIFLMKTSILEKLSGPLCDALMTEEWKKSGESGQAILEYLDKNNLFLIPMDENQKWFRYHHLFADLLQSRLKQSDPELKLKCHQQAASWLAENSYRVEAVDHSLAANDYAVAADFIEKFALPLIARNEIMTIMRWINSLPREVVHKRPRLILYQAWVLARLGDFNNLESMLYEVENILDIDQQSPDVDELRDYLVQLRAYIANITGDADSAIRVALGTKEPSEKVHKTFTNINYLIGFQLAYAYYSKGDFEIAEKIFQWVAKSAEIAEDIYNAVIAQIELAGIQLLRGQMRQATEIYDHTQEWLARKVQNPAVLEGILKVCRASVFLERNELQEANRLVQQGISEALLGSRTNTIAYGYVILANILRAQGKLPQAHDAVESATVQVQERRTYPRTVKSVKTCQVDQWLAEGNITAAQQWALEEFQTPDEQLSFYRELEYVALAHVLLASRRFEEALDLLDKMAAAAELRQREGRLIKINILRALALNGSGQTKQALQVLGKSLVKAQPEGYFRSFLDEGAQLENLLRCGQHGGVWQELALSDYVDKLLDAFGKS